MGRPGRIGTPTSPAGAGGGDVAAHEAAGNPHPTYETSAEAQAKVDTHEADTSVHGVANTTALETTTGAQAKVDTHVNDTTAAHTADHIGFTPVGTLAATDVQAAIAELLAESIIEKTWSVQGTPVVTTDTTAIRWKNRSGRTLTVFAVCASAATAPASTDLIFDLNKNGTTMYTTQGNRPTLAVAANTVDATLPDVLTVAAGDYLTMNVDQVGATVAGVSFQVFLKG